MYRAHIYKIYLIKKYMSRPLSRYMHVGGFILYMRIVAIRKS